MARAAGIESLTNSPIEKPAALDVVLTDAKFIEPLPLDDLIGAPSGGNTGLR